MVPLTERQDERVDIPGEGNSFGSSKARGFDREEQCQQTSYLHRPCATPSSRACHAQLTRSPMSTETTLCDHKDDYQSHQGDPMSPGHSHSSHTSATELDLHNSRADMTIGRHGAMLTSPQSAPLLVPVFHPLLERFSPRACC